MKKQWFWVSSGGLLIILILSSWLISVAWFGRGMVMGIWNNHPDKFKENYSWVYRLGGVWVPVVNNLPKLLDKKTYIVLLQNNTELRPSGGFMGSYVRVRFENGGMTEMLVKDIYDPDGQLAGHVEPPVAIQEAFGQGWWRLRDANWDVDFSVAATSINWFIEQGKETPVDGIVAVNLDMFKHWIGILGEVKPVTRDETIDEQNFYSLAQSNAEVAWYPGSPQKRDFLGAVGTALIEKTKEAGPINMWQVGRLVWGQLQQKQISVWMKDQEWERKFDKLGWTGKLESIKSGMDYLYIVESNLGANKANCCIQRKVIQEISNNSGKIGLNWKNDNKLSSPDKITNWGGDYINYVRVVIPESSKITDIKIQGRNLNFEPEVATTSSLIKEKNLDVYRIEKRGSLQIVGFWVITKALSEQNVEIKYSSQVKFKSILVKRQPGIQNFPYTLIVDNKKLFKGVINKDVVISSEAIWQIR